jgi:hypothetical protein
MDFHRARPLAIPLAAGAALLLAVPAAGAEDITIISTLESTAVKGSTSTTYMGENKLRTVEGDTETIVDYSTGEITFLDTKKKTYWVTTPAELEETFAELNEMLQDMPMVDRIFGKAAEVEVAKLGTAQEVAGYTCDDYRVAMGEAYVFEVCAARELEVPMDVNAARRLMFANMGPMAGRMAKLFDELAEIEGLPLVSSFQMTMMGRTINTQTRATAVEVGPIPDGTFEIPAGFKKKKSPFE